MRIDLQETYEETIKVMEKLFNKNVCFHTTSKQRGYCKLPHDKGELEMTKQKLLKDLKCYEKNESRKTVGNVHITFNKYNGWANGYIGNKMK